MLIHEFLVKHVHIHNSFLSFCHFLHLLITYALPILISFITVCSIIFTEVQFSLEAILLFKLLPLNFTIMKLFFIPFSFTDLPRLQLCLTVAFIGRFTPEFYPNHFLQRLSETFPSQDADIARSSTKQFPSKIKKIRRP
jgi:hypothetical protein